MSGAWFDLAEAVVRGRGAAGGKAIGLCRLRAAGLPTPNGFVLDAAAFRAAAPAELKRQADDAALLAARNAVTRAAVPSPPFAGGRWAVRSSATVEDAARGGAAGIFESVVDVSADDIAGAVRRIWASAYTPAARAYLEARELPTSALAVAVIAQRYVVPAARGTIYTRAPGDASGDALLIEQAAPASAWIELAVDGSAQRGEGAIATDVAALAAWARRAGAAIGTDAADVEWVLDRAGALWIVQARPIPPPADPRVAPPAAWFAFSADEPSVTWRWDVEHNPEPLSPAQAGLVERVDALGAGTEWLRVVGGYLYTATVRAFDTDVEGGRLAQRARDELLPAMERALAPVETPAAPTIHAALAAYDAVYRLYAGELTPLISAAKRELPALLRAHVGDEADALAHRLLAATAHRLETQLAAAARGELSRDALLEIAGPLSPAWDVAVPTYAERPAWIDRALERARARLARHEAPPTAEDTLASVRARLPRAAQQELDATVERARGAAALAELDDRYFARAQAVVRRALLAIGGEDALYVPLEHASAGLVAPDIADAGRARQRAQRRYAMPLAFSGGVPHGAPRRVSAGRLTGRGTGGRVRGIVTRIERIDTLPALGPDAVLVMATVTPAMTFFVQSAAAIVSEHGGLLDHGAAIARELGIPCVVGCTGALASLADGDPVWVDGAAGIVLRLDSSQARNLAPLPHEAETDS